MEIKDVINKFRDIVIQIATPYSTGTGFYLEEYNIIITNEHVVRDNKTVVIESSYIPKQIAEVVFLDVKYDLAFLKAPTINNIPSATIVDNLEINQGDTIVAIGHPYGLPFAATQGIISNMLHQENDVNYIQHDAALNPGNSGGPLVNKAGALVGVNTFIIREGNSIGFSLPISYLKETASDFIQKKGESGVRCSSCMNIVFESSTNGDYCNFCGAPLTLISKIENYEPIGISKTLEEMLNNLGYQVELTRRGANNWEISKGSATITISYHEKSGLIIADAFLCLLPKENIQPLYEFLLRENFKNQSLTFSVKNQDIILSNLIQDQYLNTETASVLFDNLFKAADHYDDILVNEYKACWKETVGHR